MIEQSFEQEQVKELIRITGEVSYIIYRDDASFYTVVRFLLHDKTEKEITATGIVEHIEQYATYDLYGEFIEHPKYGLQFKIYSLQEPLPMEQEGVIRYLSSDQFPGIGRKTAEKIHEALGDDC